MRGRAYLEFRLQVFAKNVDVQELERLLHEGGNLRQRGSVRAPRVAAGAADRCPENGVVWLRPGLALVVEHALAQHRKVRLVRGQRQHDEVGVQAVNDVALVGVIALLHALVPDELDDLVLALSHGERG